MINLSKRIVDVVTLADYFGCTERNIQLWVSEGGAPKLERGEYDLDEFAKWRIKFLETQVEIEKQGGTEKYKLDAEGMRLQNIQRSQKILEAQKKLVDFDMIREAYVNDSTAYKMALDKLDYKTAELIETIHDKDKLKKKIHAEIIDMRKRIGDELKINEADIQDKTDSDAEETDNLETSEKEI